MVEMIPVWKPIPLSTITRRKSADVLERMLIRAPDDLWATVSFAPAVAEQLVSDTASLRDKIK